MRFLDRLFWPPSKDKFAKIFVDGVRAAREQKPLSNERFSVVAKDGPVAFPGNAYQEYCSAPKPQREQVLRRLVLGWFAHLPELPEKFEDVHPGLLPIVRSRSYFEFNRLHAQIEGKKALDWPYQVLGEHFGTGLVYDMADSMRSITQEDLDAWGVTFHEALEAARHNLTRLQPDFIGPNDGKGVYNSAAKDSYDASRLIQLDLIRRFRVKGDYIALIPNWSSLTVGGSQDLDGLKGMIALARKTLKEPKSMRGIALKLEGDDWAPWLPDVRHPLYRELRMMQILSIGQEYVDQKVLLDKLHEKTGDDIFVANYGAFEQKGVARSYTVWAEGVTHTFLPKTDIIGFVPKEGGASMIAWDRVVQSVGGMMERMDMYPVRYRATEFPRTDQLKAMGHNWTGTW